MAEKIELKVSKGAFKYYKGAFFKILNPQTPLHQRNHRGSGPPKPLYFADVILEQKVRVWTLSVNFSDVVYDCFVNKKNHHQA